MNPVLSSTLISEKKITEYINFYLISKESTKYDIILNISYVHQLFESGIKIWNQFPELKEFIVFLELAKSEETSWNSFDL